MGNARLTGDQQHCSCILVNGFRLNFLRGVNGLSHFAKNAQPVLRSPAAIPLIEM